MPSDRQTPALTPRLLAALAFASLHLAALPVPAPAASAQPLPAPAPLPPPSPLADAVEARDAARTSLLLKQGADVHSPQPDGMTALHWAASHNDPQTASLLLAAGAQVNAPNRYGVTPLSLACTNGHSDLVKLLLSHGADPNTTLKGGQTALMTASRTGRVEAVAALIQKGADVNATEQRGQTALMWAAAEGHADVVDALIRAGAKHKKPLKSGFTPLCFAVRNGHIEVTRRLISAGADVNEPMSAAKGGRNKPPANTSPLLLAMENGHFELAEVLLKAGADPNDDRTGFAPLHALSWIRKPERGDDDSGTPPPRGSGRLTSLDFARALVKHGADVNLRKDSAGGGRLRISAKNTTPFLCAASTADVDYMKTLLELGADPNHKNALDQTALILASGIGEKPEGDGPATKEEHLAAVVFLLQLGADVNATDKAGETAMHGAAYKSLPSVVELLDKQGADIKTWSAKTKHGRTPLSIAQGYRPGNFKPSLETIQAIQKVMLARGVTPPPPPEKHDDNYP